MGTSKGSMIGPVANKPSGMQPQPSMTSRSNEGESATRPVDVLARGHSSIRSKGRSDVAMNIPSKKSTPAAEDQLNEKRTISDIFNERLKADNKARRKEMVFAD